MIEDKYINTETDIIINNNQITIKTFFVSLIKKWILNNNFWEDNNFWMDNNFWND